MTTDAQTDARNIAPERIWVTGSFHMGQYAGGSWNVKRLSNSRTDLGEVEYVRADALVPADVSALVERLETDEAYLRGRVAATLHTIANDVASAASLIQSQAAESAADKARIAELADALKPFAKVADELSPGKYGPAWGFNKAIIEHDDFRAARRLLNGERKG